jgi:hypothetical protein
MLTAIALPFSPLSLELIARHGLGRRVHDRGGEREIQFHWQDREPVLPAWHEGQLIIARWGCRRAESRVLPCSAWTRLTTVEAGQWAQWRAEEVVVPASLCFDSGVWFKVRQGFRAVWVRDERGVARVYPICETASHYYRVMTRSVWMPALIGERI